MKKLPYRVKPYTGHPVYKYVVRAKVAGKWERKYFTSDSAAKTYAQQQNTEMLNQGRESIEFPSSLRVMAQAAHDVLSEYDKTIEDAVRFYLPHLKATNRTVTVAELSEELLKAKGSDGASKRYLQDLSSRTGQFARHFDGRKVSTIAGREIDDWLRGLDLAPTGRNNFRRVLIVAFNFAKGRGYCAANPAKETAKAKEVETAVGILTVAEMTRLLTACPNALLPFAAIGAFAGLRRAELERLDWREIDLKGRLIEVRADKAKSARRRHVKIRENLFAWIKPLAKLEGPVVPSDYRELFDTARKAASLAKWPQNALRHSFASYALAREKNAAALALDLGHTNSNLVFQHYRELVKPKEATRYWRIKPSGAIKNLVAFSVAA